MVKKSWEGYLHAFALEGLEIPTLPLWEEELRAAGVGRSGEKAEWERREISVRKDLLAGVFGEEWNLVMFWGDHYVASSVWEIETFGCISHSFRAPVNCLSADNQWGTICQLRVANSLALTHSSQVLKCPVHLVRTEVPVPAAAQGLSSTFALKRNLFISSKSKCKATGTWQNGPIIWINTEYFPIEERGNSNIYE